MYVLNAGHLKVSKSYKLAKSKVRDARHNARIIALQRLFEEYFHTQHLPETKTDKFDLVSITEIDEIQTNEYDEKLLNQLIQELPTHREKIDEIISILAPEWPIDKIAAMDLQILRIAILEGFILQITPEKVAIDEAIELTKEFSNDQSRKFISGVLGNLIENKSKYIETDAS